MASSIDDAQRLLEKRLGEIHAERDQLERALGHLAPSQSRPGKAKRASRKPGKAGTQKKQARRPAGKRAALGQRYQQLLDALKAQPGATAPEIAKAMGIKPSQIYGLLRKAIAEKAITKKGKTYSLKAK